MQCGLSGKAGKSPDKEAEVDGIRERIALACN